MPTTVLGLALFVVLLLPGLTFINRRETRLPGIDYTPLREAAVIGVVGVLCNSIALGAFIVLHLAGPTWTPDVGALIREGRGDYFALHYASVLGWAGGLLLVATAFGWVAGAPPRNGLCRWLTRLGPLRTWFDRLDVEPIQPLSAWAIVFTREVRDGCVSVRCELTNGTVIEGLLLTGSTNLQENTDRDIVLGQPARISRPGEPWLELSSSYTVIGASQLRLMHVGYWESAGGWRSSWTEVGATNDVA